MTLTGLLALNTLNSGLISQSQDVFSAPPEVLSNHTMSLSDRYPNAKVNEVYKDNILLNLAYLKGDVKSKYDIDWSRVEQGGNFQFVIEPGQTFVYHEGVLPGYYNILIGESHFNAADGYKSDGYLYGDGVCHLASLFNWAANDAGLSVNAPRNHDFSLIPDIPKKYGTAIYYSPTNDSENAQENLYITNNKNTDVIFNVTYNSEEVNISVTD
jgi:hypothetical protein